MNAGVGLAMCDLPLGQPSLLYLDENKQLILAILDNQNLGKLAECAQYQAQLQKNLLYLAAIADAQPPTPSVRPQVVPHQAMQLGGGPFMHQGPIFPPRPLMQHQSPLMPFAGHMGIRPGGVTNGMQSSLHHHAPSSSHGSSVGDLMPGSSMIESFRRSGLASSSMDGQGGKPDVGEAAEISVVDGADNLRNSDGEHATGDATEPPPTYLKRSEGSPNNKTS